MKFLFSYLKKYAWTMAFVIFIKLLGSLGELVLPYILEYLIDEVAPTKQVSTAVFWGVVMIVVALLVRFLNVYANRHASQVAQKSTYEMRRDLFWHSVNLSGSQMDAFGLPSITSRMTSDSYNVQNFTRSMMAMGVRAPILLLGGIAVTLTMDAGLAVILCVIAPVVVICVIFISRKGIPMYTKVQQLLDTVVRIMRENITGIPVVKALSKEDYESRRFATANEALTKGERTAGIVMSMPGPVMTFFLNVGLTLVVVVGAQRVNAGVTKPGVILAFLTYFNMILNGAMGLNRIFMMMSKANASANRIAAVIQTADALTPIPEAEAAHTDSGDHIRFEHVSFYYGSTPEDGGPHMLGDRQMSLEDISFSIPKGGSLGIIGATGCGKTTIINLLMRFYDATQGHIFINGKDVRTYDPDTLHRMFGVVFQNDIVFSDTIAENIRFGREVSDEEMHDAAEDARAAEFIQRYDDGYDHEAAILGANFSGGQRQRILISRALAADPEILVLDDASSALDYKTDAALRKAIREHHSGSTTIIIAQRISSIMTLDKILMLQDGRILGIGSHDELMATCPEYREVFDAQMGEGR
ncbi:MAG: ABC transporter ATP-binding protein/permease [Firmicutes bacterium]|nr:ABC transporter ATP-binding protein/permease [Bacillota bacterium]